MTQKLKGKDIVTDYYKGYIQGAIDSIKIVKKEVDRINNKTD